MVHKQQKHLKLRFAMLQVFLSETGAVGGIRTRDLLITNQLLYQLSYNSTRGRIIRRRPDDRQIQYGGA